jgi:methionine synthase II (cobalamin-independent)
VTRVTSRRAFLATLGPLVAAPLAAAQQPGEVYRIGLLGASSPTELASLVEAFRHGLDDLGYVDGKNRTIEHPELIAERIGRYARLVGGENPIIGTDCGFGTWVGQGAGDPDVVWAKLRSVAEGARLASREFR